MDSKLEQEAQLPQSDSAMCYVSELVLSFKSYGSYKGQKASDL